MRAANPSELKCRVATSGNFIANVIFIIEVIITPWNNLKTHCHTTNFDNFDFWMELCNVQEIFC